MDPLSITAACSGIIETIGPLVLKVRSFAVGMREARKEMATLVKELSSVSMLMDPLRHECENTGFTYPQNLRQSFVEVLEHCVGIVSEMGVVLDNFASGNRRQTAKWEAPSRDDMEKLRERFKRYSELIGSNLELLSFIQTLEIKQITTDTERNIQMMRDDTEVIRTQTSHLPQVQHEISRTSTQLSLFTTTFKSQVPPLGTTKEEIEENFTIQNFIEETCSYIEMIYDEIAGNISARSESQFSELQEAITVGSHHEKNLTESSAGKNNENNIMISDSESDRESSMLDSSNDEGDYPARPQYFDPHTNPLLAKKSSVDHRDIDYTPVRSKIQDNPKLNKKPAAQTVPSTPLPRSIESGALRGRPPTSRPEWITNSWNQSTSNISIEEKSIHLVSSTQRRPSWDRVSLGTNTDVQANSSLRRHDSKHICNPESPRNPRKPSPVKRKQHQGEQSPNLIYDPATRKFLTEAELLLTEQSLQESLNPTRKKKGFETSIRPRQSAASRPSNSAHLRQVSHTSTVELDSGNSDTWSKSTHVSNTPQTSDSEDDEERLDNQFEADFMNDLKPEESFTRTVNATLEDPNPRRFSFQSLRKAPSQSLRRSSFQSTRRSSFQSFSGATATLRQIPVIDLPSLSSTEKRDIDLLLSQASFELSSQGSQMAKKKIWSWSKSAPSESEILSNALIWAINDYDVWNRAVKKVPTEKVVQYLINKGADANTKATSTYSYIPGIKTKQVVPVLHIAIHASLREVAEVLICKGADSDARDWMQRTALHLAAENELGDIIDLLISKGANMEADDWWGHSPLYVAATEGNLSAVKVLVAAGADPTTPGLLADVASFKTATRVLNFLLAKGADPNDEDKSRQTALYRAVSNCSVENAYALLEHGAEDNEALHFAQNRKFSEVRGREERLTDERLTRLLKSYAAGGFPTVNRHQPKRSATLGRSTMRS